MTEGDRKIHGVFEGEILNGVPDGEGSYSWYEVEKYVGEFKRGFFHGNGKEPWAWCFLIGKWRKLLR